MKKTFTKEFLQERAGISWVEQKIVTHTRWSVHYEEEERDLTPIVQGLPVVTRVEEAS